MSLPRLILLPLLILPSLPLIAEPLGSWDELRQFASGQAIRLSLADGHTLTGVFVRATDSDVTVGKSKSQQTASRANVAKIATKGRNNRVRNSLLGLGVGAGAGLAAGAIIDHTDACKAPGGCFLHWDNLGKEVFTPAGALAGLIVGTVIPSGNWHDVYRAK